MHHSAIRFLLLVLSMGFSGIELPNAAATPGAWSTHPAIPGGRIDAIADLGGGIVVAGSRNPKPGHIFRSTDCGASWTDLGNILGDDIHTGSATCIASAGDGVAYLLTGDAHVWKSVDWGATWTPLGQVSDMPRHENFHYSYSIAVLERGTVLVSNTNPSGGHVVRSADGGATGEGGGAGSPMALYRFEKLSDAVLVNGWAGHVYRSTDDGKTWADLGKLCEGALYATEYLGNGIVLQGGENGAIYRSADSGATWGEVARFSESADDFVYLGRGALVC